MGLTVTHAGCYTTDGAMMTVGFTTGLTRRPKEGHRASESGGGAAGTLADGLPVGVGVPQLGPCEPTRRADEPPREGAGLRAEEGAVPKEEPGRADQVRRGLAA